MNRMSSFHFDRRSGIIYRRLDSLGFPGYRVGDNGSVWTCKKGKWKKLRKTKHRSRDDRKYTVYRVNLISECGKKKWMRVCRLVLIAFVGPCPKNKEACHNDGRSFNDRLCNLQWDTKSSNRLDAVRHSRS